MSTAQKPFTKPPTKQADFRSEEELRKDRITLIVTLIVMALFMALMVWLASFGNGTVEDIDYWPMMP